MTALIKFITVEINFVHKNSNKHDKNYSGWIVIRRSSCIGVYRLLGTSYAAVLSILAMKTPFFIRRISLIMAHSFVVEI